MGLFNRNKTKTENAYQINDLKTDLTFGWGQCGIGKTKHNFGDFYFWLVTNQIYKGISNVTFTSRKQDLIPNEITDFIERNAQLLINQMINNGYMCVSYMYNDKGLIKYYIPKQGDIRKDGYGRVTNVDTVVIYSPIYQLQRKTDMMVIRPEIDLLNTLCNSMMTSSDSLGTLPILWGTSIPADPRFKEELEDMMSRKYGWNEDKYRYFLSRQELHVEQIDLKIKDLELRENIENTFAYICRYFGVPVDLIIGNSTFNNVKESKIFFYDTTIRNWAETLLKVGRNLLTATGDFLPQNTLNYKLENIPEMEKTVSAACDEKMAYLEVLTKLKENGIDVRAEMDKVFADVKKIYTEV